MLVVLSPLDFNFLLGRDYVYEMLSLKFHPHMALDKNSASSKQERSHSWHKINSSALQKGQKTIQNDQKFEGRFTGSGCARVCA
jgi:hypothetical protein